MPFPGTAGTPVPPAAGFGGIPHLPGSSGNRAAKNREDASKPHGHSYSEWAEAWWRWVMAIPAAANPLLVEQRPDTWDLGQEGPVWFLPGGLGPEVDRLTEGKPRAVFNRTCQVPAGKSLFFPIAAFLRFAPEDVANARALAAFLKQDQPQLPDEARLQIAVAWITEHLQDLTCTIDGANAEQLVQWVEVPAFELTVGELLKSADIAPGPKAPAVSEGYWLMLAPLAPGRHVIRLSGSLHFSKSQGDPFDLHSEWETTCQVNVVVLPGNQPTR